MRILCTNDDGLDAAGLELLAGVCDSIGTVWVVAPDQEQSATSHALSLFSALRPRKEGERRWRVPGTPTDCVLLGLGALVPERPDYVVSGINHGPNMGEDVFYSGTVAAAMEALSQGIRAVALSYADGGVAHLQTYSDQLTRILRTILTRADYPADTLININLPNRPAGEVRGIRVTTLGSRVFSRTLTKTEDPWGRDVYWIGGKEMKWTGGPMSDFGAIDEGYISVTPLHLDLTGYERLGTLEAWMLE